MGDHKLDLGCAPIFAWCTTVPYCQDRALYSSCGALSMNGQDGRPEAEQASLTRRTLLGAFAATSAALAFPWSAQTRADSPASTELAPRAHDWDWLVGNWNVWHRRLKERLASSNEWEEFTGK